MYKVDECLIAQAQIKAGAQVHNINNVIGAYRNWASCIEWFGPETKFIEGFERQEKKLRAFLQTGIVDLKS